MKRITLILILAVLLVFAGGVLAMSSANYRIDWFNPLTGGGGGPVSSANYAMNFTIGQSVSGSSTSTNHRGCLGYWCGEFVYRVFLPILLNED